jgi:cytochrome c556
LTKVNCEQIANQKIMLNEILSTCKQLNRLLKAKDPYHADLVATLLSKIESQIPSEKSKGLDKRDIIEALHDEANR